MNNDFYVGYLPKAPAVLARFVKRTAAGLAVLAIVVAFALVFVQRPFANSSFEFGQLRTFRGFVSAAPYPVLNGPDGSWLLVAPGKHGADDFARSYAGAMIELQATKIQRASQSMLEFAPGTEHRLTTERASVAPVIEIGEWTLTGEIVDSKCFLGVMNPGNGKVHRDCAARCISGGIPPAFIVKDARGETAFLLLTGARGEPLNKEVLDYVAEPIRIHGTLVRSGARLMLRADPSGYVRAGAAY